METSMQNQNSPLFTIEEIAAELRVPISTIYYWVHRREIPFLKMGRHLRFQREAVLAFFEKRSLARQAPCAPLAELLQPKPWYGEKPLRGSLTFKMGAVPKRKE